MPTIDITIPKIAEASEVPDLATALTGASGVEHVHVDVAGGVVSVEYDARFTDEAALRGLVSGAGYRTKKKTARKSDKTRTEDAE
jgi:copper chaperone CopZ